MYVLRIGLPYIVVYFRVTLKFWQKYDFFFRIGKISIKNRNGNHSPYLWESSALEREINLSQTKIQSKPNDFSIILRMKNESKENVTDL